VKIFARTKGALDSETIKTLLWYQGLRHSLIAEVLDAGRSRSGDLYYVRPHYAGSEFFSAASIELVKSLLSVVDFLYSKSRAHGSIKPSNLFTAGNEVQLSDPWLTLSFAGQKSEAEEDVRFTAPEVLAGGPLTPDSDLYSLGAMLYRSFAGRDPFEDSDIESLKAKHVWASPRPLTSVCHVSGEIGDMVGNLLHRDPTRRKAAFDALKNHFSVREICASRAPTIGLTSQLEESGRFVHQRGGLRVIVLTAPAGFGKTRFKVELRNYLSLLAQPMEVCEIQGDQVGRVLARRLISIIDGEKRPFNSTILSRLRDWLDTPLQDARASANEGIYRDIAALLAAVAQKTRILLVIEDIDRTNKKASALLERLVQQPIDIDVGVLVTSRAAGVRMGTIGLLRRYAARSLREVRLEPLNSAHSSELVSFLTTDVNRRILAQDRAAGNPFFAEAYCQQNVAGTVPKAIRNALSRMVLKLNARERRVSETLSIFRHPISWDTATVLTGLSEVELRETIESLHRMGLADREIPALRYPDAKNLIERSLARARRAELHAAAYHCFRVAESDEALLADHAFHGNLYQVAASLYRKLARDKFSQRYRSSPASYYALVMECARRDSEVPPLDGLDIVRLAISYSHAGKKVAARRLLQDLLQIEAVHADAELLSAVHSSLASPLLEDSATERINRLKLSISCLPQGSVQLMHRKRTLTEAFLAAGDAESAEKTLTEAEKLCESLQESPQLGDARSALLMSQGRFKDAANYLTSHKLIWASPGVVLNNLAVCLEHLGDVKGARDRQLEALAGVRDEGTPLAQILSLGNLGSMETKLGNILEAEKCFSSAFVLLEELQRREGRSRRHLGIIYSDAALHFLERGDLRAARRCIQKSNSDRISHNLTDTLSIIHSRSLVEAALGQPQRAAKALAEAKQLRVSGDFFEVQHLIAEFRVLGSSEILRDRLEKAVGTCQFMGTLYQECQVLIALTRSLLSLGEVDQANRAARRVRRLASINSYRLLESEALMLVGLSSKRVLKKEFFLTRSLSECERMGLEPLIAECSFEIGSWRMSISDSAGGIDYLSKSVSITSRLSESLPGAQRKAYLSLPRHRAARDLLAMISKVALVRRRELSRLVSKDDSMFLNLYRLATAMSMCPDTESAIGCLLETLKRSVQHSVTVALETAGKMTFHSLRNCSEQTKQRIASVSSLAGGKTYIAGSGTHSIRKTAVWAPFRSLALSGGIFMECSGEGIVGPDEREIEFLTVLGILAGAAFDQAIQKTTVQATSSSVLYGIVGVSKHIGAIRDQMEVAATNDANVLIEGESGTGKELVARGIHEQSSRGKGPFIPVDCGALPEDLIEAELFGSKKGAYTGALSDRIGLFEAAHRGTIFLDEISNLSLAAQGKLLRVLQDREVRKIGSTVGKLVDVRLIAATNRNLEKLAQQGTFRKDLLFRLKVLYFFLPPLRDRKSDIPLLATTFLERLNAANQTTKYFGPGIMQRLINYSYLGNVRELNNVIERAYYSARTVVVNQIDFLRDSSTSIDTSHDTESWFKDLSEGGEDFWRAVQEPYKRRDIPREKIVALIDYGLRETRGSYKSMASRFQIPKHEYRKFMDFLRRSRCLLDFRPYRKLGDSSLT
jgi:DNA-binding NtrC family response regulator/tetratricopeptide (TPR) repeat protein